MHPRDAFIAFVALAALVATEPSAAQRLHSTHARTLHRRHRVAVVRSGYVMAAYVPARGVAAPPRRSTASNVRAVPGGTPSTGPETQAMWSSAEETVRPARVIRTVSPARAVTTATRIPEDRFAVLFGEERPFRLSMQPTRMSGSHVEFQESGYWFTLLDAVPRSWPDTWYDTDAVSIVERDGGYALLDASYPTQPLAVRATLVE